MSKYNPRIPFEVRNNTECSYNSEGKYSGKVFFTPDHPNIYQNSFTEKQKDEKYKQDEKDMSWDPWD